MLTRHWYFGSPHEWDTARELSTCAFKPLSELSYLLDHAVPEVHASSLLGETSRALRKLLKDVNIEENYLNSKVTDL